MLLTNWLTLFQARLNRLTVTRSTSEGLRRRRPRSRIRAGSFRPFVVAAEVFEDRQLLSSTSLTPSIGGYGFVANPQSTFSIPVSGNSSQHTDQTASFSPTVTSNSGSRVAGGTQHNVLDVVASVTSNGTQTYSEIDTVTYDITSGDAANGSHRYGNFTYSLLASVGGGISTWNLIYSTSDTDVEWSTTISGGSDNGSTIDVSSTATQTITGMMNNWTNFNNNSATGFSTQTTIANSNQTMNGSYWHAMSGGQVNGTVNGGGSSFDLSTFTINLIKAPGAAWNGSGTAMASGHGSNGSSYSGSGSYFTDPVSGTIRESGGNDNGYHYNATGILGSNLAWNVSGGGNSSGSSSSSSSYSGAGTSTTGGSSVANGVENDWSMTTSTSQAGSSTDSSSFSVDMSLSNDGWTAVDGSGSGSGSSSSSASNSSMGTYSSLGNGRDIEGTTSGSAQDSSSTSFNTNSTLGADGNWITTGSASTSSSGSSSSSSSGSGTITNSTGPNGATGSVSGDADESNSQSSSFSNTSGFTLFGGGSWVLTSGSGSSSGSSSSSTSYSGDGEYSASVTIGNTTSSRSGDQGQGSKDTSQSSYSKSSAVIGGVWYTVSGSGSASGESSSSSSYDGEGEYTTTVGSDTIEGTSNESGGNSSDSRWNTNSNWVNGAQSSGWVTTGSGTNSASGSSHSDNTGSGSYSNSGSGQLAGAANITGSMNQGGANDSSYQQNSSLVMDATGAWYLVSGSGSSSSSGSSSFSSSGSGNYNRSKTGDPSLGNWNASGTVKEGSFNSTSGSSSTSFSVINGQWQTTGGSGAGAGSQSSSSSWSGSGTYSLQTNGGRMTGTISDQAGNSDSNSYTTNSTLGSNGNWTTTGSGSGSSSGSSNFSFSVASGSYSRDIGGGTVSGTVTAFNTDVSTDSSNFNISLGADGTWVLTSGSGSSTEQSGFGQSYSGSGNYSANGVTTDTGTTWSYGGSISESGSDSTTDGNYQNYSVVNGQWQNGSSGDITTTGSSGSFSDSGSGSYSQANGISGSDQQSNSNSDSFTITTTTDASGNATTTGSGSASSSSSFSYNGGGTLNTGGVSGQYTESGSGSASSSWTVQYGPGIDSAGDPWTVTSESLNTASGSASQVSFNGTGTVTTSGSSTGLTWNATTTTTGSMSSNNSASESDGYTWSSSAGALVQTSGSQSSSSSASNGSGVSTTGSYTQTLGDGTISGSYSNSSSGSSSIQLGYSGSFTAGAWSLSGSGSASSSGSTSSSYSGSGSYSGGGVSGSFQQSGQSTYSSQSRQGLAYVGGAFVTTSGTGSENGSDSSMFSFSGSSNYSESVNGGTASGSAQESSSVNWSDSWNDNSSLNSSGNWVLTSGSGSGTGSTSYQFSSSASGTFTGSFDTNGTVSGTTSQSSQNNWSEKETETDNVVNGAWVSSYSGSGSGSSSSLYSYSGSGNSSSNTSGNGSTSQASSQLTLSGSSSGSSSSSWSWSNGPSGSTYSENETTVNSSKSTLGYSSSGSSNSDTTSGDYAGGNGTHSTGSSAFGRALNESFSSTVTTVLNDSLVNGVDTLTTTVTGSGSGSGSASASSTSSSYSDSKTTNGSSSSDNWSSSTMSMSSQDSFNYTSNWSSAVTTVNGVVTSGSSSGSMSGTSLTNNVQGSMTMGGTMASGWSMTMTMSGSGSGSTGGSGSGSGSGGGGSSGSGSGSSYTTSGSSSSSWGPYTTSYQGVIQMPGFSPQAYTGGASIAPQFAAPGAPGGPAGNDSMPDFAASAPPSIPAMGGGGGGGFYMVAPAGISALGAAPANSGPGGMPVADLTSGFIPDTIDPDGYSNPIYRFIGENILRPGLGDQYLMNTSNSQMLSDGLEGLGNFMIGMGDAISLGGTKWIRQNLYSIDTVNYDSGAYGAGQVAGAVVGTVISVVGSGGTCILGGAGAGFASIARAYSAVGSAVGVAQAGANAINGTFGVGDALALAPFAGKGIQRIANFGCFVVDTPVAVGWNHEPIYVGQVSQPAGPDDNGTISVGWLVTGLGLVVATVYVRNKREEEQPEEERRRRLVFVNGKFHSEPLDDPNALPPLAREGQGGARCLQSDSQSNGNDRFLDDSRVGDEASRGINESLQSSRHTPHAVRDVAHNLSQRGKASSANIKRLAAVPDDASPVNSQQRDVLPRFAIDAPLPFRSLVIPLASRESSSQNQIPESIVMPRENTQLTDSSNVVTPVVGQCSVAALGVTSQLTPAARQGTRKTFRTSSSALRTVFWSLPFLLAGLCFWQALPGARTGSLSNATASVLPAAKSIAAPAVKRTLVTRPIQEIQVGHRVLAENPELNGQYVPETAIDPENTRLVSLHMVKPDGHELTIDTLLPLDSLAAAAIERLKSEETIRPLPLVGSEEDVLLNEVLIGEIIELNLTELGVEGPAEITSIGPCPPIEPDDGTDRRLVTSVFRHAAANVIDITTSGSNQSIGVTANHPFWSEDRQAFVPADELREGERLRKIDATFAFVESITPRAVPEPVYNFEVDGQHVYSVGADGLLVHNACSGSYTITFSKGWQYHGKGLLKRAYASAARWAKLKGVDIKQIDWSSAKNTRQAFIDEARRIQAAGGIGKKYKNFNQINSPGKKYL